MPLKRVWGSCRSRPFPLQRGTLPTRLNPKNTIPPRQKRMARKKRKRMKTRTVTKTPQRRRTLKIAAPSPAFSTPRSQQSNHPTPKRTMNS